MAQIKVINIRTASHNSSNLRSSAKKKQHNSQKYKQKIRIIQWNYQKIYEARSLRSRWMIFHLLLEQFGTHNREQQASTNIIFFCWHKITYIT